jgi:PDZ domain-containing protein
MLVIAGFVANSIQLNDYALSPGLAQPVGPLITIPSAKAPRHRDIYLTDVYLNRISALQWPLYALNSNDAIYPGRELFGPVTKPSKIAQEESLEMVFSSEEARVEALRYLGYRVPEHQGALVLQILPRSPAARIKGLQVGDAITAIGGRPTPSTKAVAQALHGDHPGERVSLSIQTVDGAQRSARVVLGHRPGHPTQAFIGVGIQTGPWFALPLRVDINSDGIGGPSAGLAFTLGIINELTGGHLTGGHRVAATGTIDLHGQVGVVGGVPQKTIAVRRAGATVFLVPKANYHDALSKAGTHLRVIPVSSLNQAIAALRRLGGRVPRRVALGPGR